MKDLSKILLFGCSGLIVLASCSSGKQGAGKTDSMSADSMNTSMKTDTSKMVADSLNVNPVDTLRGNERETKDAPLAPQ